MITTPETSHHFTELDYLAWIAAAVLFILPVAALLLMRAPDVTAQRDQIAVPPIQQQAFLPTKAITDNRI